MAIPAEKVHPWPQLHMGVGGTSGAEWLFGENILFFIFTCILLSPSMGWYNKIIHSLSGQLPVGVIAQLVEHCTGMAEVMGSNPVQA